MYELVQVADRSYYINCPAKIGLIRLNDDEVCLIDSGSDKEAGRKVRQVLDANQWKLRAIYNTHSNADHIGGNKYLQTQTGCRIFAPGIEHDFTRHTLLEPSFLFGAFPPKELRHKFLLAQESDAEYLTQECLPDGITSIPLKGHFFDMIGFRDSDDVVYLADCLSSEETLEKYGISFIYEVAAYLDTLEQVKTMEAKMFIPAHARETDNIAPLAQINIDKVHEVAEHILSVCEEPLCFEHILQKMFAAYGLSMNFEQYALVGSTVRSYLAWLKDDGRLTVEFDNNMLLWRKS